MPESLDRVGHVKMDICQYERLLRIVRRARMISWTEQELPFPGKGLVIKLDRAFAAPYIEQIVVLHGPFAFCHFQPGSHTILASAGMIINEDGDAFSISS